MRASDRAQGNNASDVIVIGGGMAGMTAALDLADAGCRVTLLEARNRLGGRVWTVHPPDWPLPVELGAEFVHGSPESTLGLIQAAGAKVHGIGGQSLLRTPNGLVSMAPYSDRVERVIDQIDPTRPDRSIAEFLRAERVDRETAQLVTTFVEGFDAASIARISAISVKNEYAQLDRQQSRVVGGYGSVVAFLEREIERRGVTICEGTCVREVRWEKQRVEVTAESTPTSSPDSSDDPGAKTCTRSSFQARWAVIALPLGVLNAPPGEGGVSFSPDIDKERALLSYLESGQVIRIVFRLREPVWQRIAPPDLSFLHAPGLEFPTWWTAAPEQVPQMTAWCGGSQAADLLSLEPAEIANRAFDALAKLVGMQRAEIDPLLVGYHHHPFGRDPWARGSYSFVRVGGVRAPLRLRDLKGDTLAFAGEYTETAHPGTVAAAIASGKRAARTLLSVRR